LKSSGALSGGQRKREESRSSFDRRLLSVRTAKGKKKNPGKRGEGFRGKRRKKGLYRLYKGDGLVTDAERGGKASGGKDTNAILKGKRGGESFASWEKGGFCSKKVSGGGADHFEGGYAGKEGGRLFFALRAILSRKGPVSKGARGKISSETGGGRENPSYLRGPSAFGGRG